MKEIQVEVHGPFQSFEDQTLAISFNEPGSNRGCLISIGIYEAISITSIKEKIQLPRPMVYDLFKNLLDAVGVKIEKIVVTEFKTPSYHSTIHVINESGNKKEIDARPSDAINLALRVNCPVFINEDLLKEGDLLKEVDVLKNPDDTLEQLQLNPNDEALTEWFRNLDPDKMRKE